MQQHTIRWTVEKAVDIPLLHIADATVENIKRRGLRKVGLLGTRFTTEEAFYRGRLEARHGMEVLIPGDREPEMVDRVIYEELVLGEIKRSSRQLHVTIMDNLIGNGAEGIILGCTEIGLLVGKDDTQVPLFDTAKIHAVAAVDFALQS